MFRHLSACALSILVLGVVIPAAAQAPLLTGLGGVRDYGMACLAPNDDGSSNAIDLTPAFPSGLRFFTRTHTQAFVNTNGNITFSGAVPTYTPDPFPVAGQPMIAPYWADVDIRVVGGTCMGGAGCGCGPGCLFSSTPCEPCHDPMQNGVWWHLEPGLMIVTWDQVGYYGCNDDLHMSFQLIITAAPDTETCGAEGDFDVEFRYNQCEWTTGDASGGTGGFGGTPAQAGFDAGNSVDFVEIMGSRTGMIHDILCTSSNVGEVGVWRFQIRSGTVVCPEAGETCDTGMSGACGVGATQCTGSGTVCQPLVAPVSERCDAIDNDCNGMVDEGDICPPFSECEAGVCVPLCFEGGCAEGQACTSDNRCVDIGCEDVTCADGERCVDGACGDACAGVVCPVPQACRAGICQDLCAMLSCDDCTTCEAATGACIPRCEADADCGAGETCQTDGSCAETACIGTTCRRGEHCEAGACVDSCASAVCPPGQECVLGNCQDSRELPDGGVPPGVDGGPVPDGGPGGPIDGGPDAGGCPVGFVCDDADPRDEGGCCSVAPGASPGLPAWAWLALALPILVRLRRRR